MHVRQAIGQPDRLGIVQRLPEPFDRHLIPMREQLNVGVRPRDLLRQAHAKRVGKPGCRGGAVDSARTGGVHTIEDHCSAVHPFTIQLAGEEDRLIDGGVHILGTSGMLRHVREHPDGDFLIATETGMLHPLRKAAPRARLTAVNPKAVCKYMKMITLPNLRDSLRDRKHEVKVPTDTAARARIPIERMVAIG